MQSACQSIAQAFNGRGAIKPVKFADAYMITRDDGTMLAVEPYISGDYKKYNNNFGYVSHEGRNTPQAFSHFSYEHSNHRMLIVDVQGVGDVYTDPQIHTADGNGFGGGNLGQEGIDKFFKTHWCNPICLYMGLPICRPKLLHFITLKTKAKESGTVAGPTPASGQPQSQCAQSAGEGFKLSEYLTHIHPVSGCATEQDLALLGMRNDQFERLVQVFNTIDSNKDGALDRSEVLHVVDASNLQMDAKDLQEFMQRLDAALSKTEKLGFAQFLCIWTGNE
eukprot:TRINITY_DN66228_c9_g9_i1.p1 TRINITY_DN66228_c9_g9~~TRINITY_DN66228_c9_g9_i1.p1  ORF type:complete len:279 (+),score=26.83 TRINITY_DN66228_c9_g9_i1:29-865(+)